MYTERDPVLKKNIANGIIEGFVLRSWTTTTGQEYVRVRWNTHWRSTCKADAVLPDTPENREMLEARYDKHRAKIERKMKTKQYLIELITMKQEHQKELDGNGEQHEQQ